MSPGLIGLLIGALAAIANYQVLHRLGERVEKPETKRVLRIVALLDLAVLPVLGFLIGTYGFA